LLVALLQGGIGKTVISSWLIHSTSVRQAFTKVVWVTLGQNPNIDHLQRIVYEQLVPNSGWNKELPDDVKAQKLDEAFHGQSVLLVLDDLCEWQFFMCRQSS
jgi:dethiobiotin synthetase